MLASMRDMPALLNAETERKMPVQMGFCPLSRALLDAFLAIQMERESAPMNCHTNPYRGTAMARAFNARYSQPPNASRSSEDKSKNWPRLLVLPFVKILFQRAVKSSDSSEASDAMVEGRRALVR